jgi:hypothetical protein
MTLASTLVLAFCLSPVAAQAFDLGASTASAYAAHAAATASAYQSEDVTPAQDVASNAQWECKEASTTTGVACIFNDPIKGNLVCTDVDDCQKFDTLAAAARKYVSLASR